MILCMMTSTRRARRRRPWGVAVGISAFLLASQPAWAIPTVVSGWKITNNTTSVVTDAELTFINTGGTISDEEIVLDAPGTTAQIQVSGQGNQVSLLWTPSLGVGQSTDFQFFTDDRANIMFDSGTWTLRGIPVGSITQTGGAVEKLGEGRVNIPEPSSLLLLLTTIGLAVATRRRCGPY